jgi:DnaJ like chaperone protein
LSYSKWIGSGLGWAFGGPIGGLVGFAVGAMLDHIQGPQEDVPVMGRSSSHATTGGDLTMSMVVLIAALMKADGTVTRSELENVKNFFTRQFGAVKAQQLLVVLRDVLKRDIPVHQVCMQIRQHMAHPVRLQLMHYLVGLAHADGRVDRAEYDLLKRIAHDLGINDKDLGSLSAMFRKADPNTAYRILEVPATATDDEVKKAYRRMAMKFHPDKVAQLGEDVQKAASEKFKKVQEAYETVQEQRGMN